MCSLERDTVVKQQTGQGNVKHYRENIVCSEKRVMIIIKENLTYRRLSKNLCGKSFQILPSWGGQALFLKFPV
jgi:hypothetical protein